MFSRWRNVTFMISAQPYVIVKQISSPEGN